MSLTAGAACEGVLSFAINMVILWSLNTRWVASPEVLDYTTCKVAVRSISSRAVHGKLGYCRASSDIAEQARAQHKCVQELCVIYKTAECFYRQGMWLAGISAWATWHPWPPQRCW